MSKAQAIPIEEIFQAILHYRISIAFREGPGGRKLSTRIYTCKEYSLEAETDKDIPQTILTLVARIQAKNPT